MPKEKRTSLKDLAAAIGVSTTLVSAVLNGKAKQYRISQKMEKRVLAAAKEMNYSPNLIAQNLRGGKSQLIGVIITDISNPFYATISRFIEDRAGEANYTVLFSSSDEKLDNTKKQIDVLVNKGIDGLIVVPCDGSEETLKNLHQESNVPLVLVDRFFPNTDISYSCLNNYKATQLATAHLIKQGYKRISVVSYKTNMNHITKRVEGYEATMKDAGLQDYINVKQINISNPKVEMQEALDDLVNKKNTEALICLTNMLAINAIYGLNEMKVNIPKDVAFIGFNRSDVFNLLHSPISYIKQPIEQIAMDAINILLDKIANGKQAINSMSLAEPELIIQQSTPRKYE